MPPAMALLRIILLFAIFGVFAALAVQNTALIPLVIVGQKTISLPLSVWLAGALVLGIFTSMFLTGITQWTAFWTRRDERKVMRSVPGNRAARSGKGWGNPFGRKSHPEDEADYDAASPQPRPASGRSAYQPPVPPKEVVDADFRVIRPPSRNLEDE